MIVRSNSITARVAKKLPRYIVARIENVRVGVSTHTHCRIVLDRDIFYNLGTIACFAFTGVLLAWRG
jgi:hypothetical protein